MFLKQKYNRKKAVMPGIRQQLVLDKRKIKNIGANPLRTALNRKITGIYNSCVALSILVQHVYRTKRRLQPDQCLTPPTFAVVLRSSYVLN